MNTLNSLKCAVVLLPALALGMPVANASDAGNQSAEQRAVASDRSRAGETAHRGYLQALPARGFHSDNLVGHDVMNRRNNETIGTVSNLVLSEDGQVVAVIISVGGILGIGQRDLAIEWDQIERKVDGNDLTLSVDLTEDSLKNAPKYSSETKYSRGEQQRADRADKRADQRADRADKRADQRADRADKRDDNRDEQRAAYGRTAQYLQTIPARGFHSDNLVGQDVKSRTNNETIGTVSNLLLDENGQVVAVIVGVGGLLGIGERDVAIAWDQVERTFDGDDVTLWVDLNEQNLKDAPKYSSDRKSSRR